MWSFGGKVTDYLEYTNSETSNNQYFDTFASSLLSMYQVGLVVRDSPRARAKLTELHASGVFCVVSKQLVVSNLWGESMAVTIAATGNINSSLFYLGFVSTGTIMFTNLFVGIVCDAFFKFSGIHDRYRDVEEHIVAQGVIRRFVQRLVFRTKVRLAARAYRKKSFGYAAVHAPDSPPNNCAPRCALPTLDPCRPGFPRIGCVERSCGPLLCWMSCCSRDEPAWEFKDADSDTTVTAQTRMPTHFVQVYPSQESP